MNCLMRSNSLWTSFLLTVGRLPVPDGAVLFANWSPSRAPNSEVGDEPPVEAFLDNSDWKKLANTSWEGPPGAPGCPAPFAASTGDKDDVVVVAAAEGETDDPLVPDIKLTVPFELPEAAVDRIGLVDS